MGSPVGEPITLQPLPLLIGFGVIILIGYLATCMGE